jgi:hypothetical protein
MELVTYKKLIRPDQVDILVEILKKHGIDHTVTEDRESLDSLYGDKQFKRQYFLKIRKEDFDVVDKIFLRESDEPLEHVDKEHYLFTFSNEELYEILSKPDEWNEYDFLLAQKILKERGEPVDNEKIEDLKKERIRELSKPDEKNRVWIVIGYIFAFLGGLLGIFIGWHLSTFKKTLPNGEKIYEYNVRDRAHGNRILIIGIIMLILSILSRILSFE